MRPGGGAGSGLGRGGLRIGEHSAAWGGRGGGASGAKDVMRSDEGACARLQLTRLLAIDLNVEEHLQRKRIGKIVNIETRTDLLAVAQVLLAEVTADLEARDS